MNWLELRDTPCKACGETNWGVIRFVNRGEQETYPMVCRICGYKSSVCMPKKTAVMNGLNLKLPQMRDGVWQWAADDDVPF